MNDPAGMHNIRIIQQFTLQAVPFALSPGHSDSMQMLVDLSGVSAADSVLDVACGPGLVACAFAERAGSVTGIDITPAMIEVARTRQSEKNLVNISWRVGDISPLPFPDARFSIVLTRYSFHHFLDAAAVLAEMIRVCRPGSRVMVVDVVMPEDKAEAYNRLEILRDPSHVKALAIPEMEAIIGRSGLSNIRTAWYAFESDLEEMLSRSFPNPGDSDKIRAMFQEDLWVDSMGIGVHKSGEEIRYSIPILVVVGEKPAGENP